MEVCVRAGDSVGAAHAPKMHFGAADRERIPLGQANDGGACGQGWHMSGAPDPGVSHFNIVVTSVGAMPVSEY